MGNGGRPAPHHPVPGNMWTEGLSTADQPQKKKFSCVIFTVLYLLCYVYSTMLYCSMFTVQRLLCCRVFAVRLLCCVLFVVLLL